MDKFETNVMAWCKECNNIKTDKILVCGEENENNLIDFVCTECKESIYQIYNNNKFRTKKCPNCKQIVSKILDGSCNHVECKCKKHICFFEKCDVVCDTRFECYEHMRNIHENIYDTVYSGTNSDICEKSMTRGEIIFNISAWIMIFYFLGIIYTFFMYDT